jgi:hypothetical protein
MKKENRNFAAICLLALFAAAPALARRRTLNWRMRPKPAVSTASVAAVEASTVAARVPVRLMAGRWDPEVRAAIEGLIAARGRGAPGYDPKVPPVAVLPWSDASVDGDPGELVFLSLVSEAKFKVNDAWWSIVPLGYGRQPTRAAYEEMVTLSSSVWTSQPSYHAWRKGMLSSYLRLCRGVGRLECRSYLAKLWAGWRQDDAQDYAKSVLAAEMRRVEPVEMIPGEPGDRKP